MDAIQQYYQARTPESIVALPLTDDMEFYGPIMTIKGAAEFREALKGMIPMIKSMDMQQHFTAGDEHCVIYEFTANMPIKSQRMAEWFTVRNGQISKIRLMFDASEMREAMAAQH